MVPSRHRNLGIAVAGLSALQQVTGQHTFPNCVSGPLASNKVCDTSLSPIDRATALIKALNITEKMSITGNGSPGVSRIGLPAYQWWQEALHGVAGSPGVSFAGSGNFSYATSFPEPITMGAAFDDPLIQSVATIVGTECRAFNNANRSGLDYWTPNINPYRDPRWGRGLETPGEDPFHLSSYVKNLIIGLEGEDPKYKRIVATCKHYAGYDMEDSDGTTRQAFNAQISTQDLVEYYLPPFQQCTRDSKVGSIMCSYNAVNGPPACANTYLLKTVMRQHWNWTQPEQYVTSDCDAVQNIYSPHAYAKSPEQAVADALNAGTDLDCGTYYPQYLPSAYSQGLFNETTLDTSLVRLYSALVRLGYFDPASATPYRSLGWSDVSTAQAQKLAYTAAAEGLVLLLNRNATLPLAASKLKSLAVVGDWANATLQMQGNYFGTAPYLHSPCYAASKLSGVSVKCATGPSHSSSTSSNYTAAISAANSSDVVLYFGGIDTNVEAEARDRTDISWGQAQINLINQLSTQAALQKKPFVLVQMGDQLDQTQFVSNKNISAILWGGYPGQSGGDALIDTIFNNNGAAPAGRLPVTQYPAKYTSQVKVTDMTLRPSSTNPGRTYKWYNASVFEFGTGQHYTNFSIQLGSGVASTYSTASLTSGCSAEYPDTCPFAQVPVTVTNTGNVTSDYVALLFVSGNYGPSPYPRKQLVAYSRLHGIAAGQSQTSTLNLTLSSIARIDTNGDSSVYSGSYTLTFDTPGLATTNFTVTGDTLSLDKWPQPS